jgi:hypothetical protein
MIRIYELDRNLTDVELIDGKMAVHSYDGDWVKDAIESTRRLSIKQRWCARIGQGALRTLPERLTGHVSAFHVREDRKRGNVCRRAVSLRKGLGIKIHLKADDQIAWVIADHARV